MSSAAPRPASGGAHRDGGDARSTTVQAMTPSPPDPSLPARLREFHQRLPLAGDPPDALLSLPDDRILALRDMPVPALALSLDEWREFLDLLRPHGVYPPMACRPRSWPCGVPAAAAVMDELNRPLLHATVRGAQRDEASQ